MGFVNSVAIAQHVHRRVIQQALGGEKQLAGKQEIRRDRHKSSASHQYGVYLDNYGTEQGRQEAGGDSERNSLSVDLGSA